MQDRNRLVPTLTWVHLTALGVGAVVGTGIYTLIGVGAERAGPAVLLAFVVAAIVCVCTAFAYAELATMVPIAGGAYSYSYMAVGELLAWIVGWSLILEYSLVLCTVAVGWSGYIVPFFEGFGISIPYFLSHGFTHIDPVSGARGFINLPAVLIIFVVAGLLMLGTRESTRLNTILVGIKILALFLFILFALPHFNLENLTPFMPFGFGRTVSVDGLEQGVMAAAAIIFFSFYGFDTIATAAEETKNPKQDLSIAIIVSLTICVVIYILVGLGAVGAVPYTSFMRSSESLSFILRSLDYPIVAIFVAAAAVVALPTVILAFFYGQTRIFYVMGRDGLLPSKLSQVAGKTRTPIVSIIFTALITAGFSAVARIDEVAALANAGTLVAFAAVALSMLILRVREAKIVRKFKAPFAWVIGPIAIIGCLYLFWSLPSKTHYFFVIWNIFGIVFYCVYGYWRSHVRTIKG